MKLTDTDRAVIRMRILTTFAEVDIKDNALATAVGSSLWSDVEQIIAVRVTAALNEAADAIEAWRDVSARYADDDARMDDARSKALQRMNAYDRSARIVRAAIPTDSAIAGAP